MVVFDDLLEADDFHTAVDGLARNFRQAHGLPEVHQLGLVVPDVEAAAHSLEERGMGPFFITEMAPTLWRERDEERQVRLKLGLAYHRGFEIEPLEPGEGTGFYSQCLEPHGRAVVQHLGLLVRDVDGWAERLASTGFSVWVRGKIRSGPMVVDFAYMDTVEEAGMIIEFISWQLFGRSWSPPAGIVHGLGRLEKWSGMRSLSV